MELPRTAADVAESIGPTIDQPKPADMAGGSTQKFRFARAGAAGTFGKEEVREQLRKRLRFIACIASVGSACALLMLLGTRYREIFAASLEWNLFRWQLLIYFAMLLPLAWAVTQLARSKNASSPRLRGLEILVLLAISLFTIYDEAETLFFHRALLPYYWATDASASAITPAVLLVAYGVLIPNTWRRCACGIGLIYLGTYLGTAIGFLIASQPLDVIVPYLVQKTIWLGMAGAIVIFGAYRIELLREAAERGREMGQYRLLEKLGEGGMGEVYLAKHALLSRPCAVKLIRADRTGDAASLARFEREVQVTAAITHPHVVHIYDYGRAEDGTFYCVMEYLRGVTLDQLVNCHGVLPPDRAVFILQQICSALAEAHAAGLTHRDVKPGNVIVRNEGRRADDATLLDFGLVLDRKAGDDKITQEGTLVGTPSFMAPEQVAGDSVDSRTDLYALGAVGFFLLTGRPPFAEGSAMRTVAAVLIEPAPPLNRTDVPESLEAILRRCLSKKPGDRFLSADELAAALAACGCAGWSHERAAEWWASANASTGSKESAATTVTFG